jgi:hypothetical protein
MNGEAPPWPVEYVLPLRWEDDGGSGEMSRYLRAIADVVEVTVVDGSDDPLFTAHKSAWPWVRHIRPEWPGRNGKARGAMTGLSMARHETVIIADDDVRYDVVALQAIIQRLAVFDLVRPQNYFSPLPWHARWDSGRILLNRALGGDYSGTVALRRGALPDRGYDTDVLFENFQLECTVRAYGGRVDVARDILVRRIPPSTRRFWDQRVRQAYDGFAQPGRLIRELALLPLFVLAFARRRWGLLAGAACAIIATAEIGRRRGGGTARFPMSGDLWALAWTVERSVTTWIALIQRLRGGAPYHGERLIRAASPIPRQGRRHP